MSFGQGISNGETAHHLIKAVNPMIARSHLYVSQRQKATGENMNKERAAQIVTASVDKLTSLVKSDGKFIYSYDNVTRIRPKKYNILRHCGTIWSMNLAKGFATDKEATYKASLRAVEWLNRKKIVKFNDGLCVEDKGFVKIGANGLAMLAMLYSPGDFADDIIMLRNYIFSQVDASGEDFIHKVHFQTKKVDPFRSDYYTGEVLFAVFESFRGLPDDKLLQQAVHITESLIAKDYGIKEQSHWMMYAIASLYILQPKEIYLAYAEKLIQNIITDTAYRARNKSTPIACRTEALCQYLTTMASTNTEIIAAAKIAVDENLDLQEKFFQKNAFIEGADSSIVQIDYIQHNMTGFLNYMAI